MFDTRTEIQVEGKRLSERLTRIAAHQRSKRGETFSKPNQTTYDHL